MCFWCSSLRDAEGVTDTTSTNTYKKYENQSTGKQTHAASKIHNNIPALRVSKVLLGKAAQYKQKEMNSEARIVISTTANYVVGQQRET